MKIIEIDKPYSWLQYPVTMSTFKSDTLHLTIKYFGNVKINPYKVERLVRKFERYKLADLKKIEWTTQMFGETPVLELYRYPAWINRLHEQFDLIADQFPSYRPHISISQEYWERARSEIHRPYEVDLKIGGLELFLGKDLKI
jgi:hypothetical protein